MKIDYNIEEVKPGIFAVVVPDNYDRCMLFLRISEYYESPNYEFREMNFNIWEFIKQYNNGSFTYTKDWSGFNVPLKVARECMSHELQWSTPYDLHMAKILTHINYKLKDGYIIGVDSLDSETMRHEICHALYYLNDEYKDKVKKLISDINPHDFFKMRDNLISIGYSSEVITDEIQAYLVASHTDEEFSKLIDTEALHSLFLNELKDYL
jgi:hypothetical protein